MNVILPHTMTTEPSELLHIKLQWIHPIKHPQKNEPGLWNETKGRVSRKWVWLVVKPHKVTTVAQYARVIRNVLSWTSLTCTFLKISNQCFLEYLESTFYNFMVAVDTCGLKGIADQKTNILLLFTHSCMPIEQFNLKQSLHFIDDLNCSLETELQNRVDNFNWTCKTQFSLVH